MSGFFEDRIPQLAWTQIWQIAAVAVAVGVLTRLCCRRRPHLAHMLWLLVLLKCLTPPLWSSPASVFSWAAGSREVGPNDAAVKAVTTNPPANPMPAESRLIAERERHRHEMEATAQRSSGAAPVIVRNEADSILEPENPSRRFHTTTILGIVWAGGAGIYSAFVLAIGIRCWRAIRAGQLPADESLVALMHRLAERLGIKRRVRLVVSGDAIGPLACGWWRPTVVVPQTLVERHTREELEPLLAHELIHVRRGDALVGLLQLAAQCLWWFHPFVWWANRWLSRERERCCDEETVACLSYAPSRYARGLLGILEFKQQRRWPAAIPGARPFEITRRRLEHVMLHSSRFQRRTPRGCWLVLVAGAILVGPGAAPPTSEEPRTRGEAAKVVTEQEGAGDLYGDPLPGGADLRLGTVRFRHGSRTGGNIQPAITFVDNDTIVTAMDDSIRFFKAEDGQGLREMNLGERSVQYVAFSPDRKTIVTMSMQIGQPRQISYQTRFWDVFSGEHRSTLATQDGFSGFKFTSDGQTFLTTGGETIRAWDVESGKEMRRHDFEPGALIHHPAISPDAGRVAITMSKSAYLWDWRSGNDPEKLPGDHSGLRTVAFSPDNRLIAIVGDAGVQLYDATTKKLIRELRPQPDQDFFGRLEFTPDGKTLIADAILNIPMREWGIVLWDVDPATLAGDKSAEPRYRTLLTGAGQAHQLAISPDGKLLATWVGGVDGSVQVWDLESGRRLADEFIGHESRVNAVKFGPRSESIVTAGEDSSVRIWDAATGRQLRPLQHALNRWVYSVAVSRDGRHIASCQHVSLHVWDAATGQHIHELQGHGKSGIHHVTAFTPDGQQVVSFGDDLFLRIWNVENGELLTERPIRPSGIDVAEQPAVGAFGGGGYSTGGLRKAAFSENAELLVLVYDQTAYLFDVATGKETGRLKTEDGITEMAVSPDGKFLLTTGGRRVENQSESAVLLRELPSGREVWRIPIAERGALEPVAISPDGKRIAAGLRSPTHQIRVWDVGAREEILRVENMTNITYHDTFEFSHDGQRLACAQADTTVLIWDLDAP
jgi:WD40 repeat protein/beta-lactamase regulating signal transducer with metallopeptidase domain